MSFLIDMPISPEVSGWLKEKRYAAYSGPSRTVIPGQREHPFRSMANTDSGLQMDKQGNPIHVVWGIPKGSSSPAVLVTAYKPDRSLWSNDFMERRK